MAQRVQVLLVDDVDGGEADETITFGLDGVTYEIDLASKKAEQLRKALQPWTEAGRRIGGGTRRMPGRQRGASSAQATKSASKNGATVDPKAVRAWAASNGVKVNDRGRIPLEIVKQFQDAGN